MRAVFSRVKVGIAGAGGLGSNCAVSLARAGIGRLCIVDFDRVSEANLDRQYYFRDQVGRLKVEALAENIARIDPSVEVRAIAMRLDSVSAAEAFEDCDIVVEALDDPEAKTMLMETMLTRFPERHFVAASGLAGTGRFPALKIVDSGKLHICGDFESEVGEEMPPVSARVAIVANMEADTVLDILLRA